MNKEELDIYLRSYSGHEYSDLEQITKDYNLKSTDDTIKNFHLIRDMKYPMRIQNSFDMWHPTELFFKKHGRFIPVYSHKHNYIEMAYIYSGEITEIINGSSITLKKGDLVILDTNVIHSIQIAGLNDIMLSFALNTEYFNNSFFNQLTPNNIVTNFILNSLYEKHKYNSYLIFQCENNEDIHNIISKLTKEFIFPNIGSDIIKDNCIKILFTELFRIHDAKGQNSAELTNHTKVSLEILNYIKLNYDEITLSSAAEHFNFNPNYFSSICKEGYWI